MDRCTNIVAVIFVVALVVGCASTPSRFYTLSASGATAKNSSDLSVAVGPVSIPAVVDRPQIVVSIGANQVQLEEFNRWALPLQNNIARVVADNLTAQLGTPRVTVFPELTSTDADYRAIIDVQRFDSVLGEAATLETLWVVRRMKDGKAEHGRTTIRQPVLEKDYAALAAAHSQAIGRLSQEIADAVRSLDRSSQQAFSGAQEK
ncbi:MAG TPA: PqiC family protein [Candidatus Binatia bacterium]